MELVIHHYPHCLWYRSHVFILCFNNNILTITTVTLAAAKFYVLYIYNRKARLSQFKVVITQFSLWLVTAIKKPLADWFVWVWVCERKRETTSVQRSQILFALNLINPLHGDKRITMPPSSSPSHWHFGKERFSRTPGTPPALTHAPPPGEHLWIDPGPAGTSQKGPDWSF